MPRNLQQLDDAIAALEARIDNISALEARVRAVEGIKDVAATKKVLKQAKREVQKIRQQMALPAGVAATTAGNRPGRNPMIVMVRNSRGKLVARNRLAR